MSKNSNKSFIRLDGGNGATYFFSTAGVINYWKSLQFYRAVSLRGHLLKALLFCAYFLFRRRASLSGTDVAQIIADSLGKVEVSPLAPDSSALISPTRDKAVVNLHNGTFVKYASKTSFSGVRNELEIYRILNAAVPESFTVSEAKELYLCENSVAFEMSCKKHIERDAPELKQLTAPLAEFFRSVPEKSKSWSVLYDELKRDEFCDDALAGILGEAPAGEIPVGLCHRDFKVWNVKMYEKPHFYDFESAEKEGVPGEDLFNYAVDPALNFYSVAKSVKLLRRSDLMESAETYFGKLGIPHKDIPRCWRYYLASRVVFWRRNGNTELAEKFLTLLKIADSVFAGAGAAKIVQTMLHLVLLMFSALLMRLAYLAVHPMESRDGIYYIRLVEEWFRNGESAIPDFTRIPPPLYCYLSKTLMHCGLSAETATLGVNMVCGVLLMIPLYFIARAFWGRGGALWCCTLGVVFPPLVRFSCTRLREAIYYLFVFSAFAFFLYAARRIKPVLNSFLCGVMCVCAVFSRYEAFELFIILPSGLLLAAFFPEKRVLPCVKSIIAFLFGAAVFMLMFKLLPGMPDITTIFWNKIYSICLGTFINPV